MIKAKRIGVVVIALLLTMVPVTAAYADTLQIKDSSMDEVDIANSKIMYQYKSPLGETIDYYYGEDGNTYTTVNGKEIMVALPLEQFEIKDKAILRELNQVFSVKSGGLRATSAPSNYVDLSQCSNTAVSQTHSEKIDISKSPYTAGTKYIKINIQHNYVYLKTTNLKKGSILTGNKIAYTCYYYDIYDEKWYGTYESSVDCTGTHGKGTILTKGVNQYVYYYLGKSSDINSFTANIWTSPWGYE